MLRPRSAPAAHVASAHIRGPYQAHAPFGPNCAVADVKPDRRAGHVLDAGHLRDARAAGAQFSDLPVEKVRVQYYDGSGTYGHSCYDDAAQAAAIMSQAAGKPVRLQFMRWDEHGWDNYGPAHLARGARRRRRRRQDRRLRVPRLAARLERRTRASQQLALAHPAEERWPHQSIVGQPNERRRPCTASRTCSWSTTTCRVTDYLKGAWLRSPLDLSFSFASEQAIDQLAHTAGDGSVRVPARTSADATLAGVLNAAAKAARWTPRLGRVEPVGRDDRDRPRHRPRHASRSRTAAPSPRSRSTRRPARSSSKHLYGAIDAGLAVNPALWRTRSAAAGPGRQAAC